MFSQTLIPMSAHTWFSGYLSGRQFHLCRPADDRLGRDSNSANSANLPRGQCAPDTMLAEGEGGRWEMDRTKKGAIYPSPISPARFPTKTNERSCYKVRFKQRFTSGKIEGLTPEKAVACIDPRHLHSQFVGSFESFPFRIPGQTETSMVARWL